MFALLGWLWSRASRVYLFFGSLYGKIRDAALNAFWWAVREGAKALFAAKAYVLNAVAALKYLLKLAIGAAITVVLGVSQTLFATAVKLAKLGTADLRVIVDVIKNDIGKLPYVIEKLIQRAVARVKGEILRLLQDWVDKFNLELGKWFIRWAIMKRISDAFQPSVLSRILDLVNRMYAFLDAFMRAPLAFIMNMLRSVFLNFLEYLLGYALQGPAYKLPPWPSWDEMEGQPGPGPSPPPGTGKIGSPLSNLYISGYTYGNPPGHRGIDFGLSMGQSVFASHDAVVRAAGWSTVGYGNFVVLESQTWWTRYAHLQQLNVDVGDRVNKGQVIGLGDDTGRSTGPHLHYEVKYRGSFVDPVTVLPI